LHSDWHVNGNSREDGDEALLAAARLEEKADGWFESERMEESWLEIEVRERGGVDRVVGTAERRSEGRGEVSKGARGGVVRANVSR
jgi:hypothetical protein